MNAARTPCSRTRARTSRYLDGVLRADARADVQDHLRGCPDCLTLFRQTLELARHARALPRRAARLDLAERTRTEFADRRAAEAAELTGFAGEPAAGRRRPPRAAAAAAVLLLIAAAAFVLGRLTAPSPADAPVRAGGSSVDPAVDAPKEAEPATRPPDPPPRAVPTRFEPPLIRAETADDRPRERRR